MAQSNSNSGKGQGAGQKPEEEKSQGQGASQKPEEGKSQDQGAGQSGGKKPKKVKVLRVRASVPRFRRAGLVFGKEETTVKVGDLTEEQIEALKKEPMLAVTEDAAEIEQEAAE